MVQPLCLHVPLLSSVQPRIYHISCLCFRIQSSFLSCVFLFIAQSIATIYVGLFCGGTLECCVLFETVQQCGVITRNSADESEEQT